MVPSGLRRAAAAETKRPEAAERLTVVELLVPAPTRSVVVLPGHRATVAFETKRPDFDERETDPMMGPPYCVE